jgi:hypothetical protein
MSRPTIEMVAAISQMDRDELKLVDDCIQARCVQLRRQHPFVYGVKRLLKDGSVRYHTRATQYEPGWNQTCAADLQHKRLHLHTRYEEAQETARAMYIAGPAWRDDTYEVFSIAKAEFVKLPCFEGYREIESFQPLGDNDE